MVHFGLIYLVHNFHFNHCQTYESSWEKIFDANEYYCLYHFLRPYSFVFLPQRREKLSLIKRRINYNYNFHVPFYVFLWLCPWPNCLALYPISCLAKYCTLSSNGKFTWFCPLRDYIPFNREDKIYPIFLFLRMVLDGGHHQPETDGVNERQNKIGRFPII